MDVVGVSDNAQTSSGFPVPKQTLASLANGLSVLPVMTINFKFGFK